MTLVAALVIVLSAQGRMEVRAEVPRRVCGLSGPVVMTPVGQPPIRGTIKVECKK
jgi:hypothetical protein